MQHANVRWNGMTSEEFSMRNEVKQGAVISAILCCVYMNGLFEELRKNRTGCWIKNDFIGIIGYADDNFLLSPTEESLQEMLLISEDYAYKHNLTFSTNPIPEKSKTKCIAFLKKPRQLEKLKLCGNDLPWQDCGKHLGNKVENTLDGMKKDLMEKRARYKDKNNELCQEFGFAHPMSKIKINNMTKTIA